MNFDPAAAPCRAGSGGALRVDAIDRKILKILQQDATATVAEVGRAVGLSTTPCWKRIQRLDASGIIKKRVAIVAREKVGLGVTVQVNIQSADHSPQAVEAFIEAVCAMPEVLEFQRVAGDADFSLRVVTVDVAALRAGLSTPDRSDAASPRFVLFRASAAQVGDGAAAWARPLPT